MRSLTASPARALAAGLILTLVMLAVWLATHGADGLGLVSFLLRWVHIFTAVVWVGLVWFVNFVQIVALQTADPADRPAVMKAIVPRVAYWFRHASTWTVVTGALLLVVTGYVLPQIAYGTGIFLPPSRLALLWLGVVGGLVMWMFVHMFIWPNLQIVLGLRPAEQAEKDAARERVHFFARLNLILSIPVTFAMVGAPHLF